MEYLTRSEIEGVDRAHDLQHILGWPSNQHLINSLGKNLIINFPVLLDNMTHANAICELATNIFKGEW